MLRELVQRLKSQMQRFETAVLPMLSSNDMALLVRCCLGYMRVTHTTAQPPMPTRGRNHRNKTQRWQQSWIVRKASIVTNC